MLNLRLPLILLLLLAAIITLWSLSRLSTPERPGETLAQEIPENSYMQVRHRIRDLQGELLYEVAAKQLDQYVDSQVLNLDEPQIRWLNPAFRNSSASARHGKIQEHKVTLNGDVELLLDPPEHSPALMRGSSLTLDAEHGRIYSAQAVVVSQTHSVMRGVGLDYRLDGSGGRLDRNVQVRQFPPSAQEPTQTLLKSILEEAFSTAHAEEGAKDTLDLSADRMEWDAQKKVSVYYGDVRATQGDMVLTADKLTVHSKDARVHTLQAEGDARWAQTLDSGKPLRARAGSILYQITQRKAILKSDVSMRVGEHQFTGDQVTYLLDEERIETPAAKKPSERIRIKLRTDSRDSP